MNVRIEELVRDKNGFLAAPVMATLCCDDDGGTTMMRMIIEHIIM